MELGAGLRDLAPGAQDLALIAVEDGHGAERKTPMELPVPFTPCWRRYSTPAL